MASISVPAALAIGGGVGAAGSVASGVLGANAAQGAARTQASAADTAARAQLQAAQLAAQTQLQMFGSVQNNLSPFIQGGIASLDRYINTVPSLAAPISTTFTPDLATLAQTPGYQFSLQQGEQATQNSYAAQGLGTSGAALKGAANYAEGLAGTTYQQQFQNWLTQQQLALSQRTQQANLLFAPVGLGETAAAGAGTLGVNSAGAAGGFLTSGAAAANNFLTSGAAASAAGQVGATNAITGALSGLSGSAGNTALLLALNNQGLFGGGASGTYGTGAGTGGL